MERMGNGDGMDAERAGEDRHGLRDDAKARSGEATTAGTSVSTPRDAALALAAAGYSVVPVNLRADAERPKQPFVRWAEFQSRIASAEEISRWFDAWPDAGVAIVTGKISGVSVADVDLRNGGRIEDWQDLSPVAQDTMSGGAHFFVAYDPAVRAQKLPGTDIKSDGGYVVVAPSRAHDGRRYTWRDGSFAKLLRRELPDAAALVAKVRERVAQRREAVGGSGQEVAQEPWIAETLRHPEKAVPGTQEELLTKLCWWASGHLDRDIAIEVVWLWLSKVRLGKLHDPWTLEHIEEKLDRAYEKRAMNPDPGRVLGVKDDTGAAGGAAKELRFVTYDELAAQVRETSKRPWLVPGWLRARGLFLIAGASHFGKTWLSIDLAVSAAIGGKFLNAYAVDPGEDDGRRVLYIVGEDDTPDFMERLDAVLAAKDAQPTVYLEGDPDGEARSREAKARHGAFRRNFRVHCDRQFLFGDKAAQAALLKIVDDFKPSLVIFRYPFGEPRADIGLTSA